jgi:hypothetical protein
MFETTRKCGSVLQDEGLPGTTASKATEEEALSSTWEEQEMKRVVSTLGALCVLLTCLVGAVGAQRVAESTTLSAVLESHKLLSLTRWSVKGARLLCVVSSPKGEKDERLSMYREENEQLTELLSRDGDLILSMYPLGSYDNRFLVAWSGGSAYYFTIYAFEKGQVHEVLNESSRSMPEILQDESGKESVFFTEERFESGRWTPRNGTTDVFKWNGKAYDKLGRVPWAKRLQCVSKEACASLK